MNEFVQSNILIILITLLILFATSTTLNIITLIKTKKINKSSKKFFSGKNGKDLEEVVSKNMRNIESMDSDIQELFKASNEIYNLSFESIHKVGLVRFNPFKDLGGDQSFSIALLNGKNDGMVISSLYTREGTRIYSKSIRDSQSEKYTLTTEEKQAIEKAILSTKNKKSPKE